MGKKKNSVQKNKNTERDLVRKKSAILQTYIAEFHEHNGWSRELERSMLAMGNETSTYMWLHRNSATILSDRQDKIVFWAAVLATVNTSTTLTSFLLQTFADVEWLVFVMTLILLGFGLVTNILLVYQQSYQFPEKITAHKEGERKHQWAHFQIQSQLQIPAPLRQVGNHFFSWMSHEINGISHIEDIEEDVLELYKQEFPDNTIPGIDGVRKIIVNTDYAHPVSCQNTPMNKELRKDSESVVETTPRVLENGDAVQMHFDESAIGAVADILHNKKEHLTESNGDVNDLREVFRLRRDMIGNRPFIPTDARLAYELRRADSLQQTNSPAGSTPLPRRRNKLKKLSFEHVKNVMQKTTTVTTATPTPTPTPNNIGSITGSSASCDSD